MARVDRSWWSASCWRRSGWAVWAALPRRAARRSRWSRSRARSTTCSPRTDASMSRRPRCRLRLRSRRGRQRVHGRGGGGGKGGGGGGGGLRFSGVARFRVPAAGAKSPSLLGEELSGRVAVNVRRLDRRTRFVGRISLGNTTRTTLGTLRDVEVEGPDKSGTKQRLRYSSGLRFSLGGIDYVVDAAGGGNGIMRARARVLGGTGARTGGGTLSGHERAPATGSGRPGLRTAHVPREGACGSVLDRASARACAMSAPTAADAASSRSGIRWP